VLPRDVQFDPVTDKPLHVDFLRVSSDSKVVVQVPVEFINEVKSPGLKRGGVLNIVRHEIELRCAVDAIPRTIVIDLEGLDIGDSIHISHVKLPENVRPVIDRDFTVASVAAPSAVRAEALEVVRAGAGSGSMSKSDRWHRSSASCGRTSNNAMVRRRTSSSSIVARQTSSTSSATVSIESGWLV
jgi:hypothetical protein